MAIRKNIGMSEETALWYEKKSKEMGVTQSALMSIALTEYIKQDNVLITMANMVIELKKHNEKEEKE